MKRNLRGMLWSASVFLRALAAAAANPLHEQYGNSTVEQIKYSGGRYFEERH